MILHIHFPFVLLRILITIEECLNFKLEGIVDEKYCIHNFYLIDEGSVVKLVRIVFYLAYLFVQRVDLQILFLLITLFYFIFWTKFA